MRENELLEFKRILDEFKAVKFVDKTSTKTFMQVTGYPHFENVCSNILAFFFDPKEEHNLNNLFIRSLLETAGEEMISNVDTVVIEREFCTSNNNRLDITIKSNSILVGIENKLYSKVYNDLHDYKNECKRLANREGLRCYMIILSLIDEKAISATNGYFNVTYDMFIEKIRKNIGDYINDANNTWVIYLKDFMKTISSLYGRDNNMNTQLLEFIRKNSEEVDKFYMEINELKKQMKSKTKQLKNLFDDQLNEYTKKMNITSWCFNNERYLTSSHVIDIEKIDGQKLTVETFIDSFGWHISYFIRTEMKEKKRVLEDQLNKLGVRYVLSKKPDTSESNFFVVGEYPINASYTELINGIQKAMEIVEIININ